MYRGDSKRSAARVRLEAVLECLRSAVTTGPLGYQPHRDHRGPGTHPAQAPYTDRRRGQGSPQATSAASLPSTETRTVRPRSSRVGPTWPAERWAQRRWSRWCRYPRTPAATVGGPQRLVLPFRDDESMAFIARALRREPAEPAPFENASAAAAAMPPIPPAAAASSAAPAMPVRAPRQPLEAD